jgi:hypothetical protein
MTTQLVLVIRFSDQSVAGIQPALEKKETLLTIKEKQ